MTLAYSYRNDTNTTWPFLLLKSFYSVIVRIKGYEMMQVERNIELSLPENRSLVKIIQ